MAIAPLSFRWEADFIDRIDQSRGLVSRTQFVAQCVESILEGGDKEINKILARVPKDRTPLQRPLTMGEALKKVQRRHEQAAHERRLEQAARLGDDE